MFPSEFRDLRLRHLHRGLGKGGVKMNAENALYLIDSDYRRRAALTSALAKQQRHIEPLESPSELATMAVKKGICLVKFDRDAVAELNSIFAATGSWKAMICYSEAPSPRDIMDSVFAGACDFLSLPLEMNSLEASLDCAQAYLDSKDQEWQRRLIAKSLVDRLTMREREVLGCLVEGGTNKEIGTALQISPRTVEIHRANMFSKLQAKSAAEAIRIAVEARQVITI